MIPAESLPGPPSLFPLPQFWGKDTIPLQMTLAEVHPTPASLVPLGDLEAKPLGIPACGTPAAGGRRKSGAHGLQRPISRLGLQLLWPSTAGRSHCNVPTLIKGLHLFSLRSVLPASNALHKPAWIQGTWVPRKKGSWPETHLQIPAPS